MLPAFDGAGRPTRAALHQDNLLTCNAGAGLLWAPAPKGLGRYQAPRVAQGDRLRTRGADWPSRQSTSRPPDDRRKERFQSHQAGVIRQPGEFKPCVELDTFIKQIKEACA